MIPVYIPTFNNPTYTKYFIDQLINFDTIELIILDNKSTNPKMLRLLEGMDKKVKVILFDSNQGPHYILRNKEFYESLPEIFGLSDPDMELSEQLPLNFVNYLIDISEKYKIGKVGFALEVPMFDELREPYLKMDGKIWNMRDWELQWWQNKIGSTDEGDDLYLTTLDTQFALYNKKYFDPNERYKCIRVAGRFTAKHLGLYKNSIVPQEEQEFYKNSTRYSYVAGKLDQENNPVFEITVHEYTIMKEEIDSLRANNKILAQNNFDMNNEIQNFYSSKTWKYTAFLRSIKNLVRKIFNRL